MIDRRKPMHGTGKAAGCAHARLGSFCKLLPKLPTWAEDCGIQHQCEAEDIAAIVGGAGGLMHDERNESQDSSIPAAYTFFAQFVDHDITLDTTSPLHGNALSEKEVAQLPNLRSASLDLDCVYGFGPEASPHLYDTSQPGRLLVGSEVDGVSNPSDVPRNSQGKALIGDPRNDENIFVSQLQLLFLRLHNLRLVGRSFENAQKDVRYHYQWVVLYDFLRRVCDPDIYNFALPKIETNGAKKPGSSKDYPFCPPLDACGRICMPVEFSVAAYRFGHSMVRSIYPVNGTNPSIELFDERFGTLGFGQVPPELVVDWRFLLDVEHCHPYANSKAIDHLLASELIEMPAPVVGRNAPVNDRSLPFRNVLRAYALGLPSGQRVANALRQKGYKIPARPALDFTVLPGWHCIDEAWAKKLSAHTPLFLYLLVEAGQLGKGQHLGPVGSAILMEVFGTMFVHCSTFLREPDWKPDPCIARGKGLTLADLVRYVNAMSD